MPRKTDWLDFAHRLDKEREAMQERAPAGVEVTLDLTSYSFRTMFQVGLRHRAAELYGHGQGRTPAKALEAAKADLAKRVAEQAARPRLVAAGPAAPPPRVPAPSLFSEG